MKTVYSFISSPGPGLALLDSKFGEQIWTLSKIRKPQVCHITRKHFLPDKDVNMWRPTTNIGNRADRISEAALEALKK